MNLLAIETSSPESTVALQFQSTVLQQPLQAQRKQIEQILPCIDGLLLQAGITLGQLDGLVLSNGPGSFTGLRLGLGILQGISLAHELPVSCVSSLRAMAQTCHRISGAKTVACARNAFMEEVYYAEYRLQGQIMQEVTADSLQSPKDLYSPPQDVALAGDGWNVYATEIGGNLAKQADIIATAEARDLITIAQADEQWFSIEEVQLNYLRKKDAWQSSN